MGIMSNFLFIYYLQSVETNSIMWSFEGDYRRKPQQRLGGASRSRNIERIDLLNQLKNDREEREVSHCIFISQVMIVLYLKPQSY